MFPIAPSFFYQSKALPYCIVTVYEFNDIAALKTENYVAEKIISATFSRHELMPENNAKLERAIEVLGLLPILEENKQEQFIQAIKSFQIETFSSPTI